MTESHTSGEEQAVRPVTGKAGPDSPPQPSISKFRRFLPTMQEISLAIITVFWGGTYYVLHLAMQTSGPFFFVGVRFLIAAFFVVLLTGKGCLVGIRPHEIRNGTLIGMALFGGYVLQTMGLQTITSSRSGFLTALYVPLVPILQWVILRKSPHFMSWLGIGLAFTGLVLLAGPQEGGINLSHGDILTLLGTLSFALEILFISMFALNSDSRRITIVQLVAGACCSFGLMPVMGEHIPPLVWGWVLCALAMGVLSAAVQLVMNWAQKYVPATRATLIYSSEPIWSGVVGHFVGEPLPPTTILGAFFIVCGVIASELRPNWQGFRRTLRGAAARNHMLGYHHMRRPAMSDLIIRDADCVVRQKDSGQRNVVQQRY